MMTMAQLERRVAALEAEIRELHALVAKQKGGTSARAWLEGAGTFKDDPFFWDAVKAGKKWRDSTKPGRKKKPAAKTRKKHVRA